MAKRASMGAPGNRPWETKWVRRTARHGERCSECGSKVAEGSDCAAHERWGLIQCMSCWVGAGRDVPLSKSQMKAKIYADHGWRNPEGLCACESCSKAKARHTLGQSE